MQRVLAIDIGGTKMDVGIVDIDEGIIERRRAPSAGVVDGDALFDRLAALLDEIRATGAADGVRLCGVGCGGPMTLGGAEVSPLNIPAWRDFPLRERLSAHTGMPVFIDNDAKALALAEGWRGRAQGERNFVGMVVSTGVGGGIVLDGRLLDGAAGNAGHIGHIVVEPDGTETPGHIRGVLEGEASGTAIAFRTGRPAAEADAAERARVATMVGRAAGSVANLLIFGWRWSPVRSPGTATKFFVTAQAEVDRVAALQHSIGTQIVPAALGADGPLIGAAAVGLRAIGHDVGVV